MAGIGGKKYPLSIIVGTVDRATAGLQKINKEVSRLTAPVRRLNNRLKALGEASGISKVGERWTAAGKAMGGVGAIAGKVAFGVGAIAGAAGLGLHSLHEMVEENDALAKSADRVGESIDTYAQLRFAFGQAGVGVEELDGGIGTFIKSLGQAKAGTGKLAGFLGKVSPALLRQVKGAKSSKEALFLMADAMKKIEDPGKRAALAAAAFGGSGEKMIGMLGEGSAGIRALMEGFASRAGSLEDTARMSEGLSDRFGELQASMVGVKSVILGALGPTLNTLMLDLQKFLADNQGRIKAFAAAFAENLPGAIEKARTVLTTLYEVVTKVWSVIGGAEGAGIALGAVLSVKVVAAALSVAQALGSTVALFGKVSWVVLKLVGGPLPTLIRLMGTGLVAAVRTLGTAILTTPIGWIIAGIVGLIAAGWLLYKNWDEIKFAFVAIWIAITEAFTAAWDGIKAAAGSVADWVLEKWAAVTEGITSRITRLVDMAKGAASWLGIGDDTASSGGTGGTAGGTMARAAQLPAAAQFQPGVGRASEARVMVDFANMPKGARVSSDPKSSADVDLSVGYQMGAL